MREPFFRTMRVCTSVKTVISLKWDKLQYRTVAGLIQRQNFLPEIQLWPVLSRCGRGREERTTDGGTSGRIHVVLHVDWHYLCVSCPQSKDRTLNIHRKAFPGSYGLQQCSHHLGLWPMTLPPTSSESILRSITGCTDFWWPTAF